MKRKIIYLSWLCKTESEEILLKYVEKEYDR